MKRYADLHVHTNHSDGLLSPGEVVSRAASVGLKILAISDHDTVSGYDEALTALPCGELTVIPAVELSTATHNAELHILGYMIDHKNEAFAAKIDQFRKEREVRGEKIVEKLNELGVDLSMETVKRVAGDSAMGRPHVADALVREEFVRTFDEAFARFLGYHAPAYVPKYHMTPEQGIDLIHEARGVAVLAHPGTLARDDLIPGLAEYGLDGIEAIYPLHDNRRVKRYTEMAERLGLIITGGSDSHGRPTDKAAIGSITVPKECYDNLLLVKERYAA